MKCKFKKENSILQQYSSYPRTTDARWGYRLHCTAENQSPIPNTYIGTAEAYFVCHIGPKFLFYLFMPSLGVRRPVHIYIHCHSTKPFIQLMLQNVLKILMFSRSLVGLQEMPNPSAITKKTILNLTFVSGSFVVLILPYSREQKHVSLFQKSNI
jgi:hypothetical protein